MLGTLFGRRREGPAADPYAIPAPRRRKHGVYELRALGDTRVQALVEAAGAGDWEAVKAGLGPFDVGRDHQVLSELSELDGVQDWIGRAVEEDEEHRATALLVSGARHVVWGWEARTANLARDVSQDQWQVFFERLELAEKQLLEAAELQPEWVTPWLGLLTSGRGMSLSSTVKESRFDAALRRDPLGLEVHVAWLTQLQPRWGGEPGEALAFAREALARAPQGHPLGCVIAMAHIEEAVEAEDEDHLETSAVQAELRKAADHSILHPAYVRRPGWQKDFNLFAMALWLAGERHTIRRVLTALDGAYTSRPWDYFEDPAKLVGRVYRRA